MEPFTKVPKLRLPIFPTEPFSPFQLIEGYLGIQFNPDYRYLSVCLSDSICYIWARRPRDNEDVSLQNVAQTKLFKKIIRILKDDKPLNSLSDVLNEKYRVEIRYNPPLVNNVIKDIECRAELITAIFNERIIEKQTTLIRFYRDVLATALEWHMKEFFKEESSQLKASTSCPTIMEEFNDPALKHSPGGRLIKRPSQALMHRSLPWKLNQPLETKDWNALAPHDAIKSLSLEVLDQYRSFWLNIRETKPENLNIALLGQPQMGLLVEEEVSRDIAFELVGEKLAADIDRTIQYIALPAKIEDGNQANKFHDLLEHLMLGLKIKNRIREEILEKWNWQVKKEEAHLSNDCFPSALTKFFNVELDPNNSEENKLRQLLTLMRQRMYNQPMGVIRAALRDLYLKFEKGDPSYTLSYQFLNDSLIEYKACHKTVALQDVVKKSKKNKDPLPPFQLEMLNVMSASLNNLNVWSSCISIKLSLISEKKKLSSSKELLCLEQIISEPLQKLGFKVVII